VTGFFCALLPLSGLAFAQGYPVKPIRLVVPFAHGGAADLVARTLSPRLSEVAGQQVVVDNRAGVNGVIGVDAVAKAPPGGYIFVLTTVGSLAITPHLWEKMPYNARRDLTPVTLAVKNPLVLVAHAAVPVKSVSELVRLANARGARLTSGSSGASSINHLALEQLKLMTGASITHVAYKGEGPAMTDPAGT
jgi:tripartite-type tricarboxylate transporter receptor subunit TctC